VVISASEALHTALYINIIIIRRTWVMAAGRNFAFEIAAKPLLRDMVTIDIL